MLVPVVLGCAPPPLMDEPDCAPCIPPGEVIPPVDAVPPADPDDWPPPAAPAPV